MCGRNTPNKILSSNNQLKIIFRSDNNVTGTGFQVNSFTNCVLRSVNPTNLTQSRQRGSGNVEDYLKQLKNRNI